MNANPFTLGHRYLLEQAAAQMDTLFVIPVKEEGQRFSYEERKKMIESAEEDYFSQGFAKNQFSSAGKIVVLEGSDYQISAATFPTYFLKDLSDAAETHIRLDLDLFQRYIAPALNAEVRFVGSEPYDTIKPSSHHRPTGTASRKRRALMRLHCKPTRYNSFR